ncbi:MAG: alpha-glucosidase C-terminal domain-containing protein [Deltaproteobacteria bacterium]|nr:alpha-glucosidase C-terminal domain-containing protein [Deltaproteobacteria bacterium]
MRPLAACAVVLAPVLTSCVADTSEVENVPIATHVEDWRDEVVYQVLTDRFANGDASNDFRVVPGVLGRYQGGDWRGLIDRLDYLLELGVTTLWISPIVRNVDYDAGFDGYHGYWAQDFTDLNPHMGDLATLRELVREAHDRGLKVVLDIVTNHVGQLFYYDINGNGQADDTLIGSGRTAGDSPLMRITEYDPDFDPRGIQGFTSLGESGLAPVRWINDPYANRMPPVPDVLATFDVFNRRGRITDYSIMEQTVLGDFPGGLKDLNTLDPRVQTAMIDVYVRWVRMLDLDGFRIDTLKHVEHDFWRVFCPAVRTQVAALGKRNFLQFGEAFDGDDALVGSFTMPGELDSAFYFAAKFQVFNDVFMFGQRTSKIRELFDQRATNWGTTPQTDGIGVSPAEMPVNFLDNHDLPRFLYQQPDRNALRLALTFLMTEQGIPSIYYGTEQDYEGGNDPANREPLWYSNYETGGETFRHIARLNAIRRAHAPLRRGSFDVRWDTDRTGDEADAGIFAFERTYEDRTVLVVLNTHAEHPSQTAFEGTTMTTSFAPGTTLVDVLGGAMTVTVGPGGAVLVDLAARSGAILVPEADAVATP